MSFSNPGYSSALQAAIDYAWASGAVLVAAAGNDGSSTNSFPAGDRGVIGVGATDATDALTASSNSGASVFLTAPGDGIATTSLGGTVATISGTSASAAMVAGAAALLRANEPALSNGVVVNRLASNADPLNGSTVGNGRLNLLRAMADASLTEIQPAGSAPIGDGGPRVGPYVAAGNGTVTGTVVSSTTGLPIAGATVTCPHTGALTAPADKLCNNASSTTTSAAGTYTLIVEFQQNSGILRITASAPGYAAGQAFVAFTANNQTKTANFALAPANSAPTDITLTDQLIAENAGDDAPVGTLTTSDPDSGDTFTYTLVSGSGDADNAAFNILGDQLRADASFDFEADSSYTVRIRTTDAGGLWFEEAFTITVTNVNETPTANSQSVSTNEDAIVTVTLTGTDPDSDSLSFRITTLPSDGQLYDGTSTLGHHIVAGDLPYTVTDAQGRVTYQPDANVNGSDSLEFEAFDGSLISSAATVTVNITPVNDAPSADAQTATALEDVETPITLTGSTGPANESGQTLTFVLDTLPANGTLSQTAGGPAIVSADLPLTLTDATLYFTSDLNTNLSGSFDFHVVDDGGTDNGGVNTSSAATVTVNITPVNDAPSFTKGDDQTVLEDAGAQSVTGWATDISAGPANESTQTIDFLVTNDNHSLFSSQPAIADNGTLTYTPAANANGTAIVTVRIQDNGGTDNGGDDTSDAQTFTITVTPVNDAPTLNAIDPQIMLSDSTKSISLTGISEGPNESEQTILSVTASSDNPSVATASVSYTPDQATGTLTITAGAAACGVAEIAVTVLDNGGTANGGVNTITRKFSVTTFHGHFLAPLKEGTINMVQKGQVVPVKIDFGCPGSMPGLTPAIQLVKGDFTVDSESSLTPIDPTLSVSAADNTGWMRAADGKYIYNMLVPKTGDMTAGTKLTIRVRPLATPSNPTNGPLMQIVLQIRK
jgi:VCBS repeat-containing protein